MRRLSALITAPLLALLFGAAASYAASPAPSGDSLRFDLQAKSGTLDRLEGTKARYALTLRGVAPQTSWSSKYPTPNGGSITTARLATRWKQFGLAGRPPEAVLALLNGRRSADAFALTLRPPLYDAKRHTLRFRAVAEKSTAPGLAYLEPQLDPARSLTFGESALFVDNGYVAPLGSGRDEPLCNQIGQVLQFPSATRTEAYRPADGREVSIGQGTYAQFAVLGDRFGGNGRTTFNLPTVAAPAGLQQRVCWTGMFPSRDEYDSDSCAAGSVVLNAGSYVPGGWLEANGASLPRDRYSTLFAAIGTRFGADDARTFRLPNVPSPGPAGVRYLVCVNGRASRPGAEGQICLIGQVTLFATPTLPSTYVPANGTTLPIRDHPTLYSTVGDTFGGDGQTNFKTPNLPPPAIGTSWGICTEGTYPT